MIAGALARRFDELTRPRRHRRWCAQGGSGRCFLSTRPFSQYLVIYQLPSLWPPRDPCASDAILRRPIKSSVRIRQARPDLKVPWVLGEPATRVARVLRAVCKLIVFMQPGRKKISYLILRIY